ncbi:MAG: amino acid ABC transporter substrate-binding protein [Planctomycetes bacterium]|nr:amino acid ABC transporter substrate-binding protein [Planctomycetota bacterium]
MTLYGKGLIVIAATSVLSLFASCERQRRVYVPEPPPASVQTIRIGAYASLTGPDAALGSAQLRGFELALREWDATESLRFELVTYDDRSRASGAAAAVRRLVEDDSVVLVAGGLSAERAVAAFGTANPVHCVCPGCGPSQELAAAGVVGTAPSERERADLLADLIVGTMGYSKVAILARERSAASESAHEMSSAVRGALLARGVQTGEPRTFTPESITEVLTSIVNDAPQAVVVALDGRDAALVGRALRRRAVPAALLFTGAPDVDALPQVDRAAALEGAYFPSLIVGQRSSALVRRLTEAVAEGHLDAVDEPALLGYAAGRRVVATLAHTPLSQPTEIGRRLRGPSELTPAIARIENGRPVPLAIPKR